MKYVKPELDIIEFEEDVATSFQVGVGDSNYSTGNNEDNIGVTDDMWE